MEIKRELQRRFRAANGDEPDIGNAGAAAQPFQRFEQRLVVARRAGAGHRVQVPNLDGLGRHHAVLRKGGRELAQDGQTAQ